MSETSVYQYIRVAHLHELVSRVNKTLKPGFILSNLSNLTEEAKIKEKPTYSMLSRERQVSPVAIWALHMPKNTGFLPQWDTSDSM